MESVNKPLSTLHIASLQDGLDFLSGLHLGDVHMAESELSLFLDSLLRTPPPVDDFLALLENSRVLLCFIAEELARNFANKPLPLTYGEEVCFRTVVATWLKMAKAYARCAQLDRAFDDKAYKYRRALMLQRSIYYSGMVLVEHHRARRELPPGLWLDVHGYYAAAEQSGVATLTVPDALDPLERETHCTAAFISLLLMELACPYGLDLRDQNLVRRWANNWSPLISLHPVEAGESQPPFVIDLKQDAGSSSTGGGLPIAQLRRLDTSRLAMQLGLIRQQLGQKMAPAQIGLGEDCTVDRCQRLLENLCGPWTQVLSTRKFRRRVVAGISRVCVGLEAMSYFIAGKDLMLPESGAAESRQKNQALSAFEYLGDAEHSAPLGPQQLGLAVDLWEEVNHSANGFRLRRGAIGKRMAHGELIAICPHASERFLLAKTSWLMQERTGGLVAGVSILAGMPQAVAVRSLGPATHADPYRRAFMLPAVPALGTEESLVLPRDWYRSGRIVDIDRDGASLRVGLKRVLYDSPEFSQVSFDVVG